jgi:hypothetical protein
MLGSRNDSSAGSDPKSAKSVQMLRRVLGNNCNVAENAAKTLVLGSDPFTIAVSRQ